MNQSVDLSKGEFAFSIFWLLRLLAQLPPFEVEFSIPDTDEKLCITLDLNIVTQAVNVSVEVTTIEVIAPGNWTILGKGRYASNKALVAVGVATPDLLTHAGYLFTSLIIRSAANTDESSITTLISSMCWNLYQPSWTGYLPLSDTMIFVASAAAVLRTPVYFNLSFTDERRGVPLVNH